MSPHYVEMSFKQFVAELKRHPVPDTADNVARFVVSKEDSLNKLFETIWVFLKTPNRMKADVNGIWDQFEITRMKT